MKYILLIFATLLMLVLLLLFNVEHFNNNGDAFVPAGSGNHSANGGLFPVRLPASCERGFLPADCLCPRAERRYAATGGAAGQPGERSASGKKAGKTQPVPPSYSAGTE